MNDFFDYEENPYGDLRIFGIGTKVKVPTGQIGTITKIGRKKLSVKLPSLQKKPTRSYEPYLLDIVI